jgi:MFS family permease
MSRIVGPVTPATEAVKSRWVLAAVSMALFCVQIDYFAMNLALPRMASDLHSGSATDLQWVISVYMLALGAFMVPAGRIGDIFGRRRALLAGVALFGVASVLCALAPSAGLLVAFRALQGLGAALIFPVSVSVLTNAFPAVRASHAIGLAYGIAGLGNAAGPLIGGLLTETVGWRWIFWLNVPAAGLRHDRDVAGRRDRRHPRGVGSSAAVGRRCRAADRAVPASTGWRELGVWSRSWQP